MPQLSEAELTGNTEVQSSSKISALAICCKITSAHSQCCPQSPHPPTGCCPELPPHQPPVLPHRHVAAPLQLSAQALCCTAELGFHTCWDV